MTASALYPSVATALSGVAAPADRAEPAVDVIELDPSYSVVIRSGKSVTQGLPRLRVGADLEHDAGYPGRIAFNKHNP